MIIKNSIYTELPDKPNNSINSINLINLKMKK